MIKAFVNLPERVDLSVDANGYFDFSKVDMVTILPTLEASFYNLKDGENVYEVQFINDHEIIDAINSAVGGDNTISRFQVRWLNVYTKRGL